MNKLFAILAIVVAISIFPQPVLADNQEAGGSAVLKNDESTRIDPRIEKLSLFLESYGSPLSPFAADFIQAADRYQIDWKLVPAITGVESTFGKRIPFNSYNAYGWANGAYYFESWEQSIDHVSRVLREKYYDRGLDTPQKINPVYAPPSQVWAGKVCFFMNKLENFSQDAILENLTLTI